MELIFKNHNALEKVQVDKSFNDFESDFLFEYS